MKLHGYQLCDDGARLKADYDAAWLLAFRGDIRRSRIQKAGRDWLKHVNKCRQCRMAELETKP